MEISLKLVKLTATATAPAAHKREIHGAEDRGRAERRTAAASDSDQATADCRRRGIRSKAPHGESSTQHQEQSSVVHIALHQDCIQRAHTPEETMLVARAHMLSLRSRHALSDTSPCLNSHSYWRLLKRMD